MSEEAKPARVRRRRRPFCITGEIVPPGTLAPNKNHPAVELPDGKTRREAFVDALGDALAELVRPKPEV